MTGKTHDLAGVTALNYLFVAHPLVQMSLGTLVVSVGANFVGALAPDLDEPTAGLWARLPAGSIFGRILGPLLGTHRLISHSLLGMWLIGWLLRKLLVAVSGVLLVDMNLVWWAFMVGLVSHLVIDTVTKEGVPWLFPIPWRIGFPPFKFLRIQTGGIIEKSFIFPGLMIANGYLVYQNYSRYLDFIQHFIR